jgi:phosphoribosylformylglycinamidine cyclo-ligase
MEIYTDEETAAAIIKISKGFNVDAKIIGRVEEWPSKKLTISTEYGIFEWN